MRPSDVFTLRTTGSTSILEEHYIKAYETSVVDLDTIEDELGLLEAALIDDIEYDLFDNQPSDFYDSGWWKATEDCIYSINPALKCINVRVAILDVLKKNSQDIQEELFNLLGVNLLDFISEFIEHRREILKSAESSGCTKSQKERKLTKKEEKKQKDISLEEALRMVYISGQAEALQYPFVFSTIIHQPVSVNGRSFSLPAGTKHENYTEYEHFTIPHSKKSLDRALTYPLIQVQSSSDILVQTAFSGYKALNRMQSICYDTAYNTNENMLVCAPTGAGKTDVAILTILKCIKDHSVSLTPKINISKSEFKIIYVAPMKALAAEITRKLHNRLAKLNIVVKECTGDIHLSRQEVQQTQILVTTPEKWDVLSRKGVGDVELVQLVKLLIIDEVHLLHDNRGAVLEAIVARTLRQVEIGQSLIRILGLSATLPNYVDVAAFLRVNPFAGMFFFDDAFRPVPLTQHFIGIKGHQVGLQMDRTMNVCYDKCTEYLDNDHQVMIFVHSRNDTVKTARSLLRLAADCGRVFSVNAEHQKFSYFSKEVGKSRNAELKELFKFGVGIHHAGMLRPDRSLTEAMFENGLLRVLLCTATLAWGVNLPAHAVIIKGTKVYDSNRGGFVDLSVLDVLQIFGRAGRPQFETHGEGIILTTHDRLSHYVHSICTQTPIESKFVDNLPDNLNAEIALGTVSTIREAVQWLSYTFLYVRMRRNPLAYGISLRERLEDPNCDAKLVEIVKQTSNHLKRCSMISYDKPDDVGFLKTKNIGRIASLFYLSHQTIDFFVKVLRPEASLEELLEMVSQSSEFESVKIREEELRELDSMRTSNAFVRIKGDFTSVSAKVNTLIQCYISRCSPDAFSLQADTNYIHQNAGRILRALFEIVKGLGWACAASRVLQLCCSFERKRWQIEHPLMQFENVPADVVAKLNECQVPLDELRETDLKDLGLLTRNHMAAGILKGNLNRLPQIATQWLLHPLTSKICKVSCELKPAFFFDAKVHGSQESFHVWLEDHDGIAMLGYQYVSFPAKELILQKTKKVEFFIQLTKNIPPRLTLRIISDKWLHSESVASISLNSLVLPDDSEVSIHTALLQLSPLPISALQNARIIAYMSAKFPYFNPVQTQVFHTLYHRDCNVLIGAPTGSGKTVMAELAIFRQLLTSNKKAVYLAPLKALVKERIDDWSVSLKQIGIECVELTGDHTPSSKIIQKAGLIVSTPEKWDAVSRKWQERQFVQQVGLIIFDEIHLLGVDGRGAVLEAIIMRLCSMAHSSVRIVGLSTALANASDLADWLHVPPAGLFNFSPAVRPVPIEVRIEGFPGGHYCPRMAAMNKPLYGHIKSLSEGKPCLIFVSSRRQTRLTAQSLISLDTLNTDMNRTFLNMNDAELETVLVSVEDPNLKHSLSFGIGLHHAGLSVNDRLMVERLFRDRQILLLVATGTLAWGINLPAFLVIVKGTEYFDAKQGGYVDMPVTDVMQMVGRAGRPQYDTRAKAVLLVAEHKKSFYRRFLYESFPVESSILNTLADHLNAEIVTGAVHDSESGVRWLARSFLARRIKKNPHYYMNNSEEGQGAFCQRVIQNAFEELKLSGCISSAADRVSSLFPGKIAAFFYLRHLSVREFMLNIHAIDSIDSVIRIISNAKEYEEAPVRHNEDNEVRDFVLQNRHMIPDTDSFVRQSDFTLPYTKVYVLFSAWMSRVDLPYTDFVTDQTLALDQALRIAQGLLELLVVRGELSPVLHCLHAMQCIKQACRFGDDALAVYFGPAEIGFLKRHHVTSLPQLLLSEKKMLCDLKVPNVDIFKSTFVNLDNCVTRLRKEHVAANFYAIKVDSTLNTITSFDKISPKYPPPSADAALMVVSDAWYGLDQAYNFNNN